MIHLNINFRRPVEVHRITKIFPRRPVTLNQKFNFGGGTVGADL